MLSGNRFTTRGTHGRQFGRRIANCGAAATPLLAEAIKSIETGLFSRSEPGRYKRLVDRILGNDEYMVSADFSSYWSTQREIDRRWTDPAAWWQSSILNTARMSWFSADRAIKEYAEDV